MWLAYSLIVKAPPASWLSRMVASVPLCHIMVPYSHKAAGRAPSQHSECLWKPRSAGVSDPQSSTKSETASCLQKASGNRSQRGDGASFSEATTTDFRLFTCAASQHRVKLSLSDACPQPCHPGWELGAVRQLLGYTDFLFSIPVSESSNVLPSRQCSPSKCSHRPFLGGSPWRRREILGPVIHSCALNTIYDSHCTGPAFLCSSIIFTLYM